MDKSEKILIELAFNNSIKYLNTLGDKLTAGECMQEIGHIRQFIHKLYLQYNTKNKSVIKKGGFIMAKFTAADLRAAVQNTGSHFFDFKTMRFFGDTMKNYGVRETTVKTNWSAADVYTADGVIIPVYELYRRHPVKHGLWESAYFDVKTFKPVYPADK